MSPNGSNSSNPSSSENNKLTVPNVNGSLVRQDAGDSISRTSSTSSGSSSQCSSIFFSDGSTCSTGASENDTPPETPGGSRAKIFYNTGDLELEETFDDEAAAAFSDIGAERLIVRSQSKGILSTVNVGSPSFAGDNLLRAVSDIVTEVTNLSAPGSRILKRGIYPPSLELPPPDQSAPFTTSPHGSGYGSPPPHAQLLQPTLDDIQEGSRESSEAGSEAAQSRRETPSGTPGASSPTQAIIFVYSPPAEEQAPSIFHAQTPPAAPVLMPVHLPEMLHAMNLSDIVTPITPLPTPLVAANDNHYFAARKFNDLD